MVPYIGRNVRIRLPGVPPLGNIILWLKLSSLTPSVNIEGVEVVGLCKAPCGNAVITTEGGQKPIFC